jgi:predicted MPP superfamily phosphohydrolase
LSIRWLHISDVHECSREKYHRVAMYEAIIRNVERQQAKPDLVFFTGDLAFAGTAAEYDLLQKRFLTPLRAALPEDCPIFTVPGNHDVDRKRAGNPRSWMTASEEQRLFQQVDAAGRQKRIDMILPRLEGYRAIERSLGAWSEDWLASETGAACSIREVDGHRLAIVGINTAWLCHDDHDWGHLTAGKTMVDAALGKAQAQSPNLTIVLGHHPLAAMTGEEEWSDGDRIRRRLEQANALYLQGHLHRSGGQRTGDSMQSVLAIQAPSGFQAGDSTVWRNGIMWGEVDFDAGRLVIEPLRWNDEFKKYVFDTDAVDPRFRVPGRDAFAYPLPGRQTTSTEGAKPTTPSPGVALPEGWRIIEPADLAAITAQRPTAEEMADWFDGSFPRFEVAAAEGIRPRRVVEELVRAFAAAHHSAPHSMVRLLTGAGGEGKSAALLQTAAGLLRGTQSWSCLWRQSSASDLPENWPVLLPRRDGHAWIVAIDDAENIGAGLPDALRGLGARTDVHIILAAREADWTLRGLQDRVWQPLADFRRVSLMGLDADDARRIADGWAAWGDAAMAKLQGQSPERVAQILLDNARALAANREEGTLLGALLMTREGEDLRQRVIRLMEPWRRAPGIGDRSLLDIYAMIAAMHAENQLYLSRAVLAYALRCDEADLDREPLRILRQEAMVDGGTTYVLTRHRRIAEVARDWLIESGYDVDRWYPFLARAALLDFLQRRANPDISRWCNGLTQHFVKGAPKRWHVARAIARVLVESDRNNPFLVTAYSSVLRRTQQPQVALALMREHVLRFKRDRAFFYEWSVAAGATGDHGLNVWLAARSLADDRSASLDERRCKLSLAGLGAAFRELAASTGQRRFAAAQAACGRLGLHLNDVDATTRGYFEEYVAAAPQDRPPSIESDIETLRRSIIEASYDAEPENSQGLVELIGEPDTYRYRMLLEALSLNDESSRRSRS